jgi:hypothetical protein
MRQAGGGLRRGERHHARLLLMRMPQREIAVVDAVLEEPQDLAFTQRLERPLGVVRHLSVPQRCSVSGNGPGFVSPRLNSVTSCPRARAA